MRRLEAELEALESGGTVPEDRKEPEPADGEDADDDADEGAGRGGKGGLLGRFKRSKADQDDEDDRQDDDADDEEAEDEGPVEQAGEAEQADEDDPGDPADQDDEPAKGGLLGRFKRSKDDTPDEPERAEAAAESAAAADGTEEDGPDAESDAEAPAKTGLLGRFKRAKDDAPEDVADEQAEDAGQARPAKPPAAEPDRAEEVAAPPAADEPEDDIVPPITPYKREPMPPGRPERWSQEERRTWRRRLDDELGAHGAGPGHENDEEPDERPNEASGRSLLGRFRRGASSETEATTEDEPDHAVAPVGRTGPVNEDTDDDTSEDDEEEERKRRIPLLWLILLLVGVIVVGVLAAFLLGDDDGNGPLGGGGGGVGDAAFVVAGAPTTSDGQFAGLVGRSMTFDASDSGSGIDEYRWDWGDGREDTVTDAQTTHVYGERGTYTVTLTIAGGGDTSTITQDVLVVVPPTSTPEILVGGEPVADPGTVGNNAFVGEPVTLDGTASTGDPDQGIASYSWDVDEDGTEDASGEQAQFSFTEEGMFMVMLTVTDALGHTDTARKMVHVAGRTNITDTVGMAFPTASENEHPVTVDQGRQMTTPVQVTATLTYTPPGQGVNENLDITLVDADGNEFAASDDGGSGEETITLTGADLSAFGQWTVRVTHQAASLNDVDYTVVVEVYH